MSNNMTEQIMSLPDLIRNEFDDLDSKIRNTFDFNEILSTKKIVITGCGDSYFAGLAAKLAFKTWARLPIEVASSLPAARYELPAELAGFPNNPMVIGISTSGGVSRTIEAINIANEMGAMTVALTGNVSSKLAKAANKTIDCSIPSYNPAPGVLSYQISLLSLYLIALHFAEVREQMTMQEADKLRAELKGSADLIEATIEKNAPIIKELSETLKTHHNFHFVGDGPNYGTALFSAAKVIESSGRYAAGQDTEEWVHLEYFTSVDSDIPTFVISPGYRGHNLLAEIIPPMKRVGRIVIAITPENDTSVAPHADYHLPVVGKISEIISPFVYQVAGNLFGAYLADATGASFFCSDVEAYQKNDDIRNSSIVTLQDIKKTS
ncbi:MAG: SIS domain-containing protein [Anaerolineaceae bacterium]|jgi:glucosamine--fructose-6-phosphate aminotransferase (isomerizing)|nr:SIS domain-containing protein [Anaerolineaceae bacterium]